MNKNFSSFIFRTRGIYMYLTFVISSILKYISHGTSTLVLFIIGVAIMVVFQAFRMYSASYLWGRQAVKEVEADFLCTSGPYSYIRNPLYLGNFIIGIGVCIAINEWYAYILFIISYAFVYSVVIPYEEKFLQEKFGNIYAEYKSSTGRLIPKLKGYKSLNKVIPNYKEGVLGEIHVPIIMGLTYVIIYILFIR